LSYPRQNVSVDTKDLKRLMIKLKENYFVLGERNAAADYEAAHLYSDLEG
jgi:hypothetical protein